MDDQTVSKEQEEQLPCPICFKTLGSKYELETHMEIHPDTAFRFEQHLCTRKIFCFPNYMHSYRTYYILIALNLKSYK